MSLSFSLRGVCVCRFLFLWALFFFLIKFLGESYFVAEVSKSRSGFSDLPPRLVSPLVFRMTYNNPSDIKILAFASLEI